MKRKIILLVGISVLLLAGLVMRFRFHQAMPLPEPMKEANAGNAPATSNNVMSVPNFLSSTPANVTTTAVPRQAGEKISNPTNWPDDPRPEVQEFYRFAKIAKLYNFDPTVRAFRQSPTFRNQVDIGTQTHEVELDTLSTRIRHLYSYRDDSYAPERDFDLNPAELRKSWIDCVGKWNQQKMIDETIRILRELGYTEYLDIAQKGKFQFKPYEYQITMQNGQRANIYPFATITLIGSDGTVRVTAEYRMGTDGRPAGLVHWTAR